MRDVLDDLMEVWSAGGSVGLGTVVSTFHSAPRSAGASMFVDKHGRAVGSVSGGCVEGALYDLSREVLDGGRPVLTRYGVSDEEAFGVGLTCGGILDIFVDRIDKQSFPELGDVARDVRAHRPVAVVTMVDHPDRSRVGRRLIVRPSSDPRAVCGDLGSARLNAAARDEARGLLASGRSGCVETGPEGQRRGVGAKLSVVAMAPQPRMIVFGAIDFASAVARAGQFLGYRVTVCDARPVFATSSRFPGVDDIVVDWPHRYLKAQHEQGLLDEQTVMCVLTHDPKFDIPLLTFALTEASAGYIGAMGSRRTHARRVQALLDRGVAPHQIERLSSPIGLDIGARTPEETAISIVAEILADRSSATGSRLALRDGPIHQDPLVHRAVPQAG
jgi:xanthine dehydrogenase accessory factor